MSRDRVLRTAIGLADREGIGALTMRRLAQELGVEAMTLYHYVANKDEMLDGMVDLVAGEVELPDGGGDWKGATRQRAIAAREVFIRHPWVVALWIRLRVGPERIGYMDSALRTYREGGLSPEITEQAFHAVENHIIGYTLQAEAFPLAEEDLAEVGPGVPADPLDRAIPVPGRACHPAPREGHPGRGRLRVRPGPHPGRGRAAGGGGGAARSEAQGEVKEAAALSAGRRTDRRIVGAHDR